MAARDHCVAQRAHPGVTPPATRVRRVGTAPTLFQLPAPVRVPVTPAQLRLLDWLVLRAGALPVVFARQVLRALMARALVERIGSAPARYRVTPYGRAVRTGQHERVRRNREAAGDPAWADKERLL